jgi:hypothetical protein
MKQIKRIAVWALIAQFGVLVLAGCPVELVGVLAEKAIEEPLEELLEEPPEETPEAMSDPLFPVATFNATNYNYTNIVTKGTIRWHDPKFTVDWQVMPDTAENRVQTAEAFLAAWQGYEALIEPRPYRHIPDFARIFQVWINLGSWKLLNSDPNNTDPISIERYWIDGALISIDDWKNAAVTRKDEFIRVRDSILALIVKLEASAIKDEPAITEAIQRMRDFIIHPPVIEDRKGLLSADVNPIGMTVLPAGIGTLYVFYFGVIPEVDEFLLPTGGSP